MNLYKRLDKRLRKAPKRVIGMYNNLISGIIGGAIIFYLILLGNLHNILFGFFYVIFLWLLGFLVILSITKHLRGKSSKKEEIKNYLWNTFMAILGGFYLTSIFFWDVNPLISSIILIFVFIFISSLRSKK